MHEPAALAEVWVRAWTHLIERLGSHFSRADLRAHAVAHLKAHGIAIECGPMQRFGAKGPGTSVYFRDPDGSLMEFMSYGAKK